nr:unnamed protein product [Callosobruchus analis]
MFVHEKFQLSLAYLADISEFLNNLNLTLQEFLNFKADSTVKDDFQLLTLEQFGLKIYKINPLYCVAEGPLKALVQFSSTYLCDAGLSALDQTTEPPNIESDLRVALSSTQPSMDLIVQLSNEARY